MMRSVAESQDAAEVVIHLLHGPDIPRSSLRAVEEMLGDAPVHLVAHLIAPAMVAGFPEWGRIPATMWYRIFLPELLPDVERVLYVDVDVLVVDRLDPLWELDLDAYYLAAVTNVPEQHMIAHAQDLGLDGPGAYFNSGVLLMNLELMRRHRCSEALAECARERAGELLWPDQDALNIVLGAHRLPLHPRWNAMNSIRTFPRSEELLGVTAVNEARLNPAIIHFEGPRENKPWHLLCTHPLRAEYRRQRRLTPWPRAFPEGVTLPNLARLARRSAARRARRDSLTP